MKKRSEISQSDYPPALHRDVKILFMLISIKKFRAEKIIDVKSSIFGLNERRFANEVILLCKNQLKTHLDLES